VTGPNYFNYLGSLPAGSPQPNSGTSASAGVQLTLPLFQGGRPAAQVRQAQAQRSQALENVTGTERAVISQARSAYAIWQSSQQVIASSETAVNANKLSLEGVRAENSVGTRTILDILNAEQELLNSQVTLVTARRDAYVAGFALLAAMGNAEARDLGLEGGALYDPVANYRRVRNKINDFGSDSEPVPVSVTTAQTPPQTAVVTKPLDPLLDTPVDRSPGLTTGAASPNRQ
jgi:outer membrane protein